MKRGWVYGSMIGEQQKRKCGQGECRESKRKGVPGKSGKRPF